jgi:hypothetical protein
MINIIIKIIIANITIIIDYKLKEYSEEAEEL